MSATISRIWLSEHILRKCGGWTATASEIAAYLRAPPSSTMRALRGMVRRGQAVRLESGRYRLGIVEG